MKRLSLGIIVTVLGTALTANAQTMDTRAVGEVVDGVTVNSWSMERSGDYMVVDLDLGLGSLNVGKNRAVVLTPYIHNHDNTAYADSLPSVGVYGRQRYFYYLRNYGDELLTGTQGTSYRVSELPESINCHVSVPFQDWMSNSDLRIHRNEYGCCSSVLDEQDGGLGRYLSFFPELVYIRPQGVALKERALEGWADIKFIVDKTGIEPDYMDNAKEFAKITDTLDSLRNDSDITVKSVWLKGFASPESSFAHNTELAKGRVESLKNYIQQLYAFPDGVISTDYEPEDWAGLRLAVEASNMDHKAEILAYIDSDHEPDKKEWVIKSTYPEEYQFMLKNFYPSLRHTDYRIAYEIRAFISIEEILEVYRNNPNKLSLNELYLLSEQYEPGSEEFSDIFDTSVKMYPDDKAANLNAANAALRVGDLEKAEKYLSKAGDSAEAIYGRAALAILRKDYSTARTYLQQSADMGLQQATKTLDMLDEGVQ